MDLVLGLSMTSSSVRWVLVEATTDESATVDRGSFPLHDDVDAAGLVGELLAKAAPRGVHAIGLTWTRAAEAMTSAVWQALTDRRVENVIAVSDVEAAEALACGIAEAAGCERVAVCVVEPDASVVASASPDGVAADRLDPSALPDLDRVAPEAVFVLGSGDVEGVVSALQDVADAPVVSAEEADLALARGAALAAASAVALLEAAAGPRRSWTPTAALAAVLVAAVVTFVVSVSAALGLRLTPEETAAPQMARSEQPVVREAAPPPAPAPPPPAAVPVANQLPVPEAAPVDEPPAAPPPVYDEPIAPAPAEVPPAPEYVPPAPPPNYEPPAPAAPVYVPPAAPVYVPPAAVPTVVPPPVNIPAPQPRLRDRIIERIPIINRFHEPQYGYTP
ncbi:hypothetical protein Mycch_0747 [Mycolicibacterium chubuense NBB4]|uniref:Agglutinin receptor n=1 Tax=Mycolicibacterium chubuense (strain NBB4) TaxID=710421 RepID=I4BE57_MYCCN|nr:hypothetical protein [Mycolicibacterium chubuense]AFM15564.1 hypothetical protein Mycch_0747 [Mycolicibacterium chubuense NBB4]